MTARVQKVWTVLATACLLLCFVFQAVLSLKDKSVTVDEITYIAAGYYHLRPATSTTT